MKKKLVPVVLCAAVANALLGGSLASAHASTQFHAVAVAAPSGTAMRPDSFADVAAWVAATAGAVAAAAKVVQLATPYVADAVAGAAEVSSSSSSSSGYVPGKAPDVSRTAYLHHLAHSTFDR